ncbi:hypothetical protein JWG45_08030 [Leptospira sp. 201903070]|uniref:Cys-rich protein n=1 Tax=Leptospira ainlahdjerensis TaxID=2810033 RepID=A0ABS2U9Q2_9LEPT|nr:hypothetical protein [Leptospira ainlahdjerensis]MBM9577101.1 hypothetical protein [Leptospira ainlahdjerensis]
MKIRIYVLILLLPVWILCRVNDNLETRREVRPELPTKLMSREEIETIKACNIKLDFCLKECDKVYPDTNAKDQRRGNCRDVCVRRLQGEEGCLIHYNSIRPNRYRSSVAPYRD